MASPLQKGIDNIVYGMPNAAFRQVSISAIEASESLPMMP
jgi:hypothetical protein